MNGRDDLEVSGVLVIAEIGVNHDGDPRIALDLVDAAVEAGADAVKVQSFRTELLVSDSAPQATYQQHRAPASSQAAMLRDLELDADAHRAVADRCERHGVEFLSTPFDPPSLELVRSLGVGRLKVASGELTNWPMLLLMARTRLPILMSTGMATLDEVDDALAVIRWGRSVERGIPSESELTALRDRATAGTAQLDDVTILHCTSSYPAAAADVHLRAMGTLADAFGLPVGYSDHTTGHAIAFAAVALGAVVVEKHLTLDRSRPGPDHAASLEPAEFATMVDGIREVSRALGSATKQPSPAEREIRDVARRSVVTTRSIRAGEILREDDLTALRPGTGVHPRTIWSLVGTAATRDLRAGDPL